MIAPNSKKETLETIFEPPSPPYVRAFFEFMKTHVGLEVKGMGVGLRENKHSLATLSELHGYEYVMVSKFLREFEVSVLNQHYEQKS